MPITQVSHDISQTFLAHTTPSLLIWFTRYLFKEKKSRFRCPILSMIALVISSSKTTVFMRLWTLWFQVLNLFVTQRVLKHSSSLLWKHRSSENFVTQLSPCKCLIHLNHFTNLSFHKLKDSLACSLTLEFHHFSMMLLNSSEMSLFSATNASSYSEACSKFSALPKLVNSTDLIQILLIAWTKSLPKLSRWNWHTRKRSTTEISSSTFHQVKLLPTFQMCSMDSLNCREPNSD